MFVESVTENAILTVQDVAIDRRLVPLVLGQRDHDEYDCSHEDPHHAKNDQEKQKLSDTDSEHTRYLKMDDDRDHWTTPLNMKFAAVPNIPDSSHVCR